MGGLQVFQMMHTVFFIFFKYSEFRYAIRYVFVYFICQEILIWLFQRGSFFIEVRMVYNVLISLIWPDKS